MSMDVTTLEFGYRGADLENSKCAFGARAILKNGDLDIVWDRTARFGSQTDLQAMQPFVERFLMSCRHKAWAQDEVYRMEDGTYVGEASPQQSHGYLYITVRNG